MLSSHLYWFVYRRRNKLLVLLMIIFCIVFIFYQNDNNKLSKVASQTSKIKKSYAGNKVRVNRETYTTPEPCRGCPGEAGQGVQLTVNYKLEQISFFFILIILGRRVKRFRCSYEKRIF
jgi:hypothetical protein